MGVLEVVVVAHYLFDLLVQEGLLVQVEQLEQVEQLVVMGQLEQVNIVVEQVNIVVEQAHKILVGLKLSTQLVLGEAAH